MKAVKRKLDNRSRSRDPQVSLAFTEPRVPHIGSTELLVCKGRRPIPTVVFDTYWRFAAERQAMFFRRFVQTPYPWTSDPILAKYKFTNAYRASDRTSQYLIRHVIYDGDQSFREVFFRTILFKLFNKIETWEMFLDHFKAVTLDNYSFRDYDRILTQAIDGGRTIYSGAYIMPSGGKSSLIRKHRVHLQLLEKMMKDDLPLRIESSKTMQQSFSLLRAYPMIGDFLAYQYITDLNYSENLRFQEDEFVAPGPGALSGIRKCFSDLDNVSESDLIKRIGDEQERHFLRLDLDFQSLWERRLQYIDCQNLFCEVDKYARLRHPEFQTTGSRTRIKQRFQANQERIDYWYPPKWGLNRKIRESKLGTRNSVTVTADEEHQVMGLNEFQRHTDRTDKNPIKGPAGIKLPLLGLFGEVGSLLSELKKKQRDTDSYVAYSDTVIEEFGDVLWYFANIAARSGLDLSILAQRMFRQIDDWDEVESHDFGTFGDLQSRRHFAGPANPEVFQDNLIRLAGRVGALLNDVSSGRIENNRDVLSAHLVEIFRELVSAADHADIALEDVANRNVRKTLDRWPTDRRYPPLFDDNEDEFEKLPRIIEMEIVEKGRGGRAYVIQRCKGITVGDRLTDNIIEEDDYRFHDVFHLGYAAILGWSPVMRALFKVKRKNNPVADETQDGARAILIEEGVSTWIFNHAKRLNYFATISSLDFSLLKAVRELVKGYEVDSRPLWMWEHAILEGFKVFRQLREKRKGVIRADLINRTLTFEEMP